MTHDPETVRSLREAFVNADTGSPAGEDCPQAERIWQVATGQADRESVRATIDHASRCAHCAELWRLARYVDEEPGGATSIARRASRTPGWLVAAAASLLLAASLWVTIPEFQRREPSMRGVADSRLASSLESGAILPRDRFVLRWTGGLAGETFYVRVRTEDLQRVFNREGLTASELTVPTAALARLPSGTRLVWQVEALDQHGQRELSPVFSVVLE